MVIKKLKPDMVVYDVRRATGINTFQGKWSTWNVVVKDIDEENERVYASWNFNTPRWYHKKTWSKWRINRPID